MKKVVVVGGGAAGMMAALRIAEAGHTVVLLEKNEKLGKKLFITGKGRCNITNACDVSDLFSNIVSNPKFLYSAFYGFTNQDVVTFFEGHGLRTKQERGRRVFPRSDKSSDVIKVLSQECRQRGVQVQLRAEVDDLMTEPGEMPGKEKRVTGVILKNGDYIAADAVVLATGGVSYPSTGSTGDGYRMAQKAGHTIVPVRAGLTGMTVKEEIPSRLQGLTLKNCALSVSRQEKPDKSLYSGMGELLFTHYGVSGPLILSASSLAGDYLAGNGELQLHIDLKPALSDVQLDKRILRDFDAAPNLDIKNALVHLLPKSLIPVMLSICGIQENIKVNHISREQRKKLCDSCKDLVLTLTGLRPIEEAIITRGGIKVGEVDPSSMASKKMEGLYFAGEILDLDALTGGFNLQIAWSTGYAACSDIV